MLRVATDVAATQHRFALYVRDYHLRQADVFQHATSAGGPSALHSAARWPGILEDNTFVDAGTSGFVKAATDPLSTFALDVDTGSYSVGRSLLASGHRPPTASIRPEEWVNAFEYGDVSPTESDLGVTIDGGPVVGDEGMRLIRIGVGARQIDETQRPPVAMTFVVETSGSMDIRERRGLVKASLALLAEHLRDDDTIAPRIRFGSQPAASRSRTTLRLASTVADFVQLMKAAEPVVGRGLTLESLGARANQLRAEGVPGAEDLAELIELAVDAKR